MSQPRRPPADTPSAPTLRKMQAPYASVVVVSEAPQLAGELRQHLDPRTGVVRVSRVAELVRDLRVLKGQRRMIVIDWALRALLDPTKLDRTLLEGALVVLWKATPEDEPRVRASYPGITFVRCGDRAGPRELAAFVHLGH